MLLTTDILRTAKLISRHLSKFNFFVRQNIWFHLLIKVDMVATQKKTGVGCQSDNMDSFTIFYNMIFMTQSHNTKANYKNGIQY